MIFLLFRSASFLIRLKSLTSLISLIINKFNNKFKKFNPFIPFNKFFNKFVLFCFLEKNSFDLNLTPKRCGTFLGFGVELDAECEICYNTSSPDILLLKTSCFARSGWTANMDLLVSCQIENRTGPTLSISLPWEYAFNSTLQLKYVTSIRALYENSAGNPIKRVSLQFEFSFRLTNSEESSVSESEETLPASEKLSFDISLI